jgi:hypothetical protein
MRRADGRPGQPRLHVPHVLGLRPDHGPGRQRGDQHPQGRNCPSPGHGLAKSPRLKAGEVHELGSGIDRSLRAQAGLRPGDRAGMATGPFLAHADRMLEHVVPLDTLTTVPCAHGPDTLMRSAPIRPCGDRSLRTQAGHPPGQDMRPGLGPFLACTGRTSRRQPVAAGAGTVPCVHGPDLPRRPVRWHRRDRSLRARAGRQSPGPDGAQMRPFLACTGRTMPDQPLCT